MVNHLNRSQTDEAYHAVNISLFIFVEDGHKPGLLSVAACHSCVEVDYVCVIIVVTDVVVLPPPGVGATVRS